jgi:nitroimidazol reductase NimA-like FMN-containing flavoprotein (pyridoxamine 5'-phosphate oxidase superfamily)
MEYPRLERLDAVECRRLLPTAPVARLAVATPTFPTIEPVSFALVEGEVIVVGRAGSAAEAVPAGTRLTFEADVLDNARQSGWSVTVTGRVEDLDPDVAVIVTPLLRPWPLAPGDRLLLVRSDRVAGRRIVSGPGQPAASGAPRPPGTSVSAKTATGFEVPAGSVPVPLRRRVLTADEARRLLAESGQSVGRLVITLTGEPLVFPVNFGLDGEAVVFRTKVGTKLAGIARSMASFEVDRIDAAGAGWSVTIEGLAQELLESDPPELKERVGALDIETWPGGERPHTVRIFPYEVRGTVWAPVGTPSAQEAQVRLA